MELTVEEKAALVSGTDFMNTNPIPRLGIPSLCMADGPHGLRKQVEIRNNGTTKSEPSTCFPSAAAVACSWNPENMEKMGEAIAQECRFYGVNLLLGPGMNIKRNPLCGRNFEYFSEDPLLTGQMAAAEVHGLKRHGVGACLKHFALNNSETFRFVGNSVADERAMREIYWKGFEIAVRSSDPAAVMCAYNKINGTFCSENKTLLTDVLRTEWGFSGLVMSDWGAVRDRAEALRAGLDLEMPGDTSVCRKAILDGIRDGSLEEDVLDFCAENVLRMVDAYSGREQIPTVDWEGHHVLSAEIACDSAVLMKNDGLLPLSGRERLFIVGELFQKMRYQGAGSSMINPTRVTSPKEAFDAHGVAYTYVPGYSVDRTEPDAVQIQEAVSQSEGMDTVLVFAGLTDSSESEGVDRAHMRLPENQLALISALLEAGRRIAVVLFGGSPVELPFSDGVSAILNLYLPGQNGGGAVWQLLYGIRNPSGKLAETWFRSDGDLPCGETFGKSPVEVYRESVYVGYRYDLSAKNKAAYPFGFGLSYTSFRCSDLSVQKTDLGYLVRCTVQNIGERDGAEVVQLYVEAPKSDLFKPVRELRAFAKIKLKAGEKREVRLSVNTKDLFYWNLREKRFAIEGGEYLFQICSDCRNVLLSTEVSVEGDGSEFPYGRSVSRAYRNPSECTDLLFEKMSGLTILKPPECVPITPESRLEDLRQTGIGRFLCRIVFAVMDGMRRNAERLPEGAERENRIKEVLFLRRLLETQSLRTMSMSVGARFPWNVVEGVVLLANGHILKSIRKFCSKIRVPRLPKDQKKRNPKQ